MKKVAFIGLPNCGKSSLFNAITGSKQKVANFPGITVERKSAKLNFNDNDLELIDLPGLYSLDARSSDERLTRDFILNKKEKIDKFILVIDSTNLKKSLYLALQLKELKLPLVIALNMADIAKARGQELDIQKLKSFFETENIFVTVATNLENKDEILDSFLVEESKPQIDIPENFLQEIKSSSYVKKNLENSKKLYEDFVIKGISKDSLTEKLDAILLHPVAGLIILFAVLFFTFQLLFVGADPFVGYIEMAFEYLAMGVDSLLPDGYFKSLVIDGVIAGVGAFVVFLPHIIFLFLLINLLEDFGYLGRVAFLLDYIMRRLGLPGKAVVPLLSSHACAIPGIMGARIIENQKQRLLTMMISPLMTCSARLPVYTLLIAALFSDNSKLLGFDARGVMMFFLYFFAIAMGFVISFITKKITFAQTVNTLMMEMPAYRIPQFKSALLGAWGKGVIFLKKAGTVIFALSVLIWVLVSFPGKEPGQPGDAINYSYAAKIGKTFEPVFRPIGFDWKITTALIPSFGAREVLVSAMGTVMAVDEEDEDRLITALSKIMGAEYSLATLMSLLIWFVFSPQCIATFGVLKRETNGYKYPIIFGVYTLSLAYIFSYVTFNIFNG